MERTREESVRLVLLGGARIEGATSVARLERRTAALVAYLALEGPTPRSRIAGLLWPDSKERTARNNLAQAIRRLRAAAGAAIVVGDEQLELEGASSDVGELLARDDRTKLAGSVYRELLAGYDLDDLPELETWLRGTRAAIARAWARAADEESARREEEGEIDEAIAWAEARVAADPVSEQAHLRVARLLLVRGDAPAAMRAYERCKTTLARELGMSPSPSMLDVLKAIRAGTTTPRAKRDKGALSAQVLRPPRVGRASEWAALERAYAERRTVVVSGEPGVGKSRLARDFAATRGPTALFEGRLSDPGVPFASLSRALRLLLPRIERSLAPWARSELARVLPELGEGSDRKAPPLDKLRLFDAVTHAFAGAAASGIVVLVVDDLQWLDEASAEACAWVASRAPESGLSLFTVLVHRRGELTTESAEKIERAIGVGAMTRIELAPLSTEDTLALVTALEQPALAARAEDVARASAGYPLYVLEIVRSILTDTAADDGGSVPLSDRMKALFRRRLDRLSPSAARLARVAAIAGTELSVALAAHVLETSALDLADAFGELEHAEILTGASFTHDLLAEAVREALPPLVRAHVHARIADHLATSQADASTIADHFLAAGKEREAAPHVMAAADRAMWLSCVGDACRRWEEAARLYERVGDAERASHALFRRSRAILGGDGARIAAELERLAASPTERARARYVRSRAASEAGDLASAIANAAEAAELARADGDATVEAEATDILVDAQIRAGHLDEAERVLGPQTERARTVGDPFLRVSALYHRGQLLAARSLHREAAAAFSETVTEFEKWGGVKALKARGLAKIADSELAAGDVAAAERTLARVDRPTEDPFFTASRAAYGNASARVALARRAHRDAFAIVGAPMHENTPRQYVVDRRLLSATLAFDRGDLDRATRECDAIASDPLADPGFVGGAALLRARIAVGSSKEISAADVKLVVARGSPLDVAELACLRALAPEATHAEELLAIAEAACASLDLASLRSLFDACRAEVAHRTGRVDEAIAASDRACEAIGRGQLWGLGAEAALVTRALVRRDQRSRDEAFAYVAAPLEGRRDPAYLGANRWRREIHRLSRE